jgi:hypothetical protein
MSPQEWIKTSRKIKTVNPVLGEAFNSVALILEKKENNEGDWHLTPIWGHSRTHTLFPFYPADIATLQV